MSINQNATVIILFIKSNYTFHQTDFSLLWVVIRCFKLEAQWAEPVSLTFHSALRKLYTEPSIVPPTKFLFIWPSGFREEYLFLFVLYTHNKSTAHRCWMLDFFVSDIKLQAIYKVIHTSNLSTDWGQHFLQVYWVSS